MFEKLELTRMAQSLAAHAGSRVGILARNIANADTPGFRAHDLPAFQTLVEGQTTALHVTRTGHIGASGNGAKFASEPSGGPLAPNGNDVSLDLQMQKAVEARQSHEMALAIYRSTSSILKTSLGRNA